MSSMIVFLSVHYLCTELIEKDCCSAIHESWTRFSHQIVIKPIFQFFICDVKNICNDEFRNRILSEKFITKFIYHDERIFNKTGLYLIEKSNQKPSPSSIFFELFRCILFCFLDFFRQKNSFDIFSYPLTRTNNKNKKYESYNVYLDQSENIFNLREKKLNILVSPKKLRKG